MSFAAHGNWCGPGWSARQWKDAKDLTEEDKLVPAVDELDQACKEHDIGIAEGDPLANKKFYEKAAAASWYGYTLAQFVKIGGPPLQNYLRGGEMPTKLLTREQKRQQIKQRAREKQKKQEQIWDAQSTEQARINVNKRKASQELKDKRDNPAQRIDLTEEEETKDGDEFPVVNPDDAIHATIDEEMNQNLNPTPSVQEATIDVQGNLVTPNRPPTQRDSGMTREDQPLRGYRPTGTLTNLLNQEEDETMEEPTEIQLARSSNDGGTTTRGNRETLVRYNARAEMGVFTETRTAYLPITVYFSINRTKLSTPIPLRFRVDWPHDILLRNTLVQQEIHADGTTDLIRQHGLSNDMARRGCRGGDTHVNTGGFRDTDPAVNERQLYPFPTTVVGDTAAQAANNIGPLPIQNGWGSYGTISNGNVRPAYARWYAKQYQYAHCMETSWKVTYFSGEQNRPFQNLLVLEGHDVQSTGNTDTIPDEQPLGRMMQWPYLKKHYVQQRTDEQTNKYIISGVWKDSDKHPMSMIPNDEEVKTWTRLDTNDFKARDNEYREDVVLLHFTDPDSTPQGGFVNCRLDLRYKVQFKDLTNTLRWFGTGTGVTLNSKDDCVQRPFPTNTTGSTANPEIIRTTSNAITFGDFL